MPMPVSLLWWALATLLLLVHLCDCCFFIHWTFHLYIADAGLQSWTSHSPRPFLGWVGAEHLDTQSTLFSRLKPLEVSHCWLLRTLSLLALRLALGPVCWFIWALICCSCPDIYILWMCDSSPDLPSPLAPHSCRGLKPRWVGCSKSRQSVRNEDTAQKRDTKTEKTQKLWGNA